MVVVSRTVIASPTEAPSLVTTNGLAEVPVPVTSMPAPPMTEQEQELPAQLQFLAMGYLLSR
jgi:hypothetical protein